MSAAAVEARARAVRRIVAEVTGRSIRGTRPTTTLRELDLRASQRDEIAWRIRQVFGVQLLHIDWVYFETLADLAAKVELWGQVEGEP